MFGILETIFISYLLDLATTQPPPMPHWLHFLLLHCTEEAVPGPSVFPSGCEGKLGVALESLQGLRDLT